jgi:glycosyltransferase involved in cell wall biosynthesis
MPGGCSPERVVESREADLGVSEQIRFGYFGALAAHAGVLPLVESFLASRLENTLHICGYGRLGDSLARLAERDARLKFHGLLPSAEDCLRLAQSWDVLVNPRPPMPGNENNFPSKIFEYALCGRAILTSRMAGVDTVLGPEAFYFDTNDFRENLRDNLVALAGMRRAELRRRGIALRERVTVHYSWPKQAAAMAEFIARLA